MTTPTLSRPPEILPSDFSVEELERGWRYIPVTLPDGREALQKVLLTREDYLNPQEGDFVPEDTFHSQITRSLFDMLSRHFAKTPAVTVFADLVIKWPGLPNAAPDIAVIPNVKDPHRRRGSFNTAEEGAQPILAIEVVSPRYRKEDREDKVRRYEEAGVPEYLLFDQRPLRGQMVDEVLGYRLAAGRYRPIAPNEDGLILAETVDLWFGLEDGQPVIIEAESGERLLTSKQLEARAEAAQARLAELEAELKRLRGEAS